MASSPTGRWGDNFFALGGPYCGEPWWGKRLYGVEMLLLVLWGGHPRFSNFYRSHHLKENLPVVNINYLRMTYNFKGKLDTSVKRDNCIVKVSLMSTYAIILTTLRSLKSIIYLSLLLL